MRNSTAKRLVSAIALVGVVAVMSGCGLARPSPIKETFLLHVKRAPASTDPIHHAILKVGTFAVAPPFQGKGLVYRADDLRYESDFYDEFFVTPRAMITDRVTAWLKDAKLFKTVLASTNRLDAAYRLEGLVTEMYGDFRDKDRPTAVLAIQFYLVRTEESDRPIVFDGQLRQEVAMPGRSAESLAKALSTALERILVDLERQLTTLELADEP